MIYFYHWIKFNTYITAWLTPSITRYTRHLQLTEHQSSEWLPTSPPPYYLLLKPNFYLSKEQLSSTSEITEIEDKLETQNMDRVTYVSGNVFEGLASESIPHKTGRLCLDGGATYEVTCSQPNVNISLHIGILRTLYNVNNTLHMTSSFRSRLKACWPQFSNPRVFPLSFSALNTICNNY